METQRYYRTATVITTCLFFICFLFSPDIAYASPLFQNIRNMELEGRHLLSRTANPTNSSLGKCQGNCRGNDALCLHSLSCFRRDNREAVPGCSGRGARRVDYCYQPPKGVLVYVGDRDPITGIIVPPEAIFPLKVCSGHCTSNTDCKGSLECYTPVGIQVVPGCNSTGIPGKSYCYDPSTAVPPSSGTLSPAPTIDPGQGVGLPVFSPSPTIAVAATFAPTTPAPTTPSPTTAEPSTSAPTTPAPTTPMPTTSMPTAAPTSFSTLTQSPTSPPELHLKGGVASALSLGLCEGDCNGEDGLCEFGLTCFIRSAVEPVPGCLGQGLSGAGYCHKPVDNSTLVYLGEDGYQEDEDGRNVFPLRECAGDCDDDWDCESGLRCWFRDVYEIVPNCVGKGVQGRDYCYRPLEDDELHVHSAEEIEGKAAGRVNSGGGDGLSQAAVISIIVISVVAANIILCVCCKWLLSRDPTRPVKNVNHDEASEGLVSKTAPPPPLEADGGILLKSVESGESPDNGKKKSKRATNKSVNFAESIRELGRLKYDGDDENRIA